MAQMLGADLAELRHLAAEFGRAASELEGLEASLTAAVSRAPWRGASGERFRGAWYIEHRRRLAEGRDFLATAQRSLTQQAQQQEHASSAGPGFATPQHSTRYVTAGQGGSVLSQWLDRVAEPTMLVLQGADLLDSGAYVATLMSGVVASRAPTSALGHLSRLPSAWFRGVPIAGSALAVLDVAVQWRGHGATSSEVLQAGSLGAGAVAASSAAGPLGGLAWQGGVTVGLVITRYTQVDESLASAWMETAYGHLDQTDTAVQQEIIKRKLNPALFAWDVTRGGFRAAGEGASQALRSFASFL